MTGTSLAGTYFSTVYLTDAGTQNPAVITNTGLLKGVTGVALQGTTSAAWVVDNQGTILGTEIAAIVLQAGGTVTNEVGGLITGIVSISGSAGTVVNASTLADIRLVAGGAVTNALGATLLATGTGISGSGGAVTVTNAGAIHDTGILSFANGINLSAGGLVSNASTGTITAGGNGVVAFTVAASVTNAGRITAASGSAVYLHAGGSVTNQSGGSLTGGIFGVRVLGGAGTIDNDGIINGTSVGPFATQVMGVAMSGGTLINRASGTIGGYVDGAYVGAGGTVTNQGSIGAAHGNGLYFTVGGVLTNASGGTIAGTTRGLLGIGGAVSVTNQGSITGASASGIELHAGGAVTNLGGGTIAGNGSASGLYIGGGSGLVVNQGLIIQGNTFGYGVQLMGGGSITNTADGTISGNTAIRAFSTAAATVVNAGTIAAGSANGIAIRFTDHLANRLIDQPGAVFVGTIAASAYPNPTQYPVATLELASAASAGTITGLGTQFAGFGQVVVDTNAYWVMTGSNALTAKATLTNQGTLKLTGATFSDPGVLVNNGLIGIDPSTVTVAGLSGTGVVTIGADSTLIAQGSVAAGETIDFAGGNAHLEIDSPSSFAGIIGGFGPGSAISFAAGTVITGGTILGGNTLELFVQGGGTIGLQLDPGQDFGGQGVTIGAAGVSLACFRAGTRIATPRGPVAVEHLLVGEPVLTALDPVQLPRTVKWVGWRGIDCRRHQKPEAVWPVRVAQAAFSDSAPHRDLWLSPNHAVFVDGVLVPVRCLVNGDSVRQEPMDTVVYYHVELDEHDVLLAEGLSCESYLDTGDRADFANGGPVIALHPTFPATLRQAGGCAPLMVVGPEVERVRARLAERSRAAAAGSIRHPAAGAGAMHDQRS